MSGIVDYFSNIAQDVGYIFKNPDMPAELLQSRVASLALRVLGGVLLCMAASSCAGSLASMAVSPVTGIVGVGSSLVLAAFAYDLIIIGDNMRRINNVTDGAHLQNVSFFDMLSRIGNSVVDVVAASAYEAQHEIPYVYRGTILFDPMIRFLRA